MEESSSQTEGIKDTERITEENHIHIKLSMLLHVMRQLHFTVQLHSINLKTAYKDSNYVIQASTFYYSISGSASSLAIGKMFSFKCLLSQQLCFNWYYIAIMQHANTHFNRNHIVSRDTEKMEKVRQRQVKDLYLRQDPKCE